MNKAAVDGICGSYENNRNGARPAIVPRLRESWPLVAQGQQSKKVPRPCFLTFDPGTTESPAKRFEGFFQGLRELGYVNGQTITVDYHHPDGMSDRFPALAAEGLRLKPDIIVVSTTPAAQAAKNATHAIPIVMYPLGDPVATGLVASLARPGGNVTGLTFMASGLAAKRLELLKEAAPGISRVLVLSYFVDPIAPPQVRELETAAHSLGITLLVRDIRTADDIPAAFDAGVRDGAEAVVTTAESIFIAERNRVVQLVAQHRLPSMYPFRSLVDAVRATLAGSIPCEGKAVYVFCEARHGPGVAGRRARR